MIKNNRLHVKHKGKIENTQIPMDIPRARHLAFIVQPAEQTWHANPNHQSKPGWHLRGFDYVGQSYSDQNNVRHSFIHHDAGDCHTGVHAYSAQ